MLKVISHENMINIDGDGISYACIKDMYTTGDGNGLQVSNEENRFVIFLNCREVVKAVRRLEGVLKTD